MPNDLPQFLPGAVPSTAILDLSHTLSDQAAANLNQLTGTVGFKAVVVVLPKEYNCPDPQQLAIDLARRWGLEGAGKNLLLLVDLKGHKVRAHGSPDLSAAGITSDYISNSLIPRQFIPYMRQGDLATAIRLTIVDVNRVQASAAAAPSSVNETGRMESASARPISAYDSGSFTSISLANLGIWIIAVPLAIGILIFCNRFATRRSRNRRAYDALRIRLDNLYAKADQLGQAADFLKPSDNVVLSHKIADFFAQLATLQKAQGQLEKLMQGNFTSPAKAESAIDQCDRYATKLHATVCQLVRTVNEQTGAVATYEPQDQIETESSQSEGNAKTESNKQEASPDGRKVSPALRRERSPKALALISGSSKAGVPYRSPSWIAEPDYARRIDDDGLADIGSYFAAKDQRQSYSASQAYEHADKRSSRADTGNGGWFSGSASSGRSGTTHHHGHHASDGGGIWGEHTASTNGTSSDGGGSWDSGSSSDSSSSDSSSSSDGGGSW